MTKNICILAGARCTTNRLSITMANTTLTNAREAKQDEFYTQYYDIERINVLMFLCLKLT